MMDEGSLLLRGVMWGKGVKGILWVIGVISALVYCGKERNMEVMVERYFMVKGVKTYC